MRIGLIAMSGVRVKSAELAALGITLPGFIRRGKVIASLPSLGLLTVAALTPPDHEVALLEIDRLEPSSRLPEFDLVGISSLTANIDEAYKVADHFRQRGSRVVMGGLHVSQLPQEALVHAHAVVINGAEEVWPRVIRDAESNHLQSVYYGANDNVFSNERYVRPRFDLLRGRAYNRVTVQTSRGCPRDCEFCGASLRITRRFNQKPVELVIEEIREARRYIDQPFFEFADDNTFINKEWSKNLLKQLAGEQIHYFTETDVSIADDLELCDLLAESGCKQVLIGFESPDASDLSGLDPRGWKMKQADRYKRAIEILQGRGVSVNGCFILGLDNHTPEIFPKVLQFVREAGLAEVQYAVLTPFPETPLYTRMKREGRLLAERFWDACTLFDVNYKPLHMTVRQLQEGLHWLFQETYSRTETSKRLRAFIRQSKGSSVTQSGQT